MFTNFIKTLHIIYSDCYRIEQSDPDYNYTVNIEIHCCIHGTTQLYKVWQWSLSTWILNTAPTCSVATVLCHLSCPELDKLFTRSVGINNVYVILILLQWAGCVIIMSDKRTEEKREESVEFCKTQNSSR